MPPPLVQPLRTAGRVTGCGQDGCGEAAGEAGLHCQLLPSQGTHPSEIVKEEGISVAQAAKDHGISEGTIYGWMVKGATGVPSWAEFSRLQKQNRELLELVGEITLKLSMTQKNS